MAARTATRLHDCEFLTMDILADSLVILWRLDVLAALLVGSVGGVIIGAIPGVGLAVAIAMLLPATFSLEPIVGLTALLGIYGSSMYGGAIPAILINTPGTAVNALTTYEGTPMTARGEGQRAWRWPIRHPSLATCFRFSVLSFWRRYWQKLRLILAVVRFLAALLGIVLVVVAHRGRVMAGMMASFGIFLHTIGLEPIQYSQRFTFGLGWLSGGINLIVVVLGLFAISQAFILLRGTDRQANPDSVSGGYVFRGSVNYSGISGSPPRRCRQSVSLWGMIPGVGEFTAQFLSYTLARRTSKSADGIRLKG